MTALEKELDRAIDYKIRHSPAFVRWLLSKTHFSGRDVAPVLVRSNNPWYQSPQTGKQSETDVLAVFEDNNDGSRFALHIEHKRLNGWIDQNQVSLYQERSRDWANTGKFANYQDSCCIIIAPRAFLKKFATLCEQFDAMISFDEIAKYITIYEQ